MKIFRFDQQVGQKINHYNSNFIMSKVTKLGSEAVIGCMHLEENGVIGFHKIDWNNKSTSIGYWLGEDYVGNGLMTKSVKAFVDYALIDLGLNRVEIRAAVENKKSRAIPERLGFTHEGTIRQSEWLYDHYVDHEVYGMLASDWKK